MFSLGGSRPPRPPCHAGGCAPGPLPRRGLRPRTPAFPQKVLSCALWKQKISEKIRFCEKCVSFMKTCVSAIFGTVLVNLGVF